ncbi:MAG: PD-(D/E)XK nuclease family protein, partial [Niastella sp.]|nr:PD-(D/E)XK nuclease family protein [Niastella sp.]
MNNEQLEPYYADLLAEDIVVTPDKTLSFFDIGNIPHYEPVISSFYAYYFRPGENHGLGDLFLTALLTLIKTKTGRSIIQNTASIYVQQEVATLEGKYIDIVISEYGADGTAFNAIVIENKIYASLYNDLPGYYRHAKASNQKIGVVLSIRPENALPADYINITHFELVTAITQSLGAYLLETDAKQAIIVQDFLQHIKYLSMTPDMSSQYDFYLKYEEKIRNLAKLQEKIKADIFKQVGITCDKLNLDLKSQYHSSLRYFSSKTTPVYYTIWLPELFTESHTIAVMVELDAEGMKYLNEINQLNFSDSEKLVIKETVPVRKSYIHYAVQHFRPDPAQIKNLAC